MPSVARVTKKGSKPRSKTDFYPTKQEFADGHIRALKDKFHFHGNVDILDVGIGGGVYGVSVIKELPIANLYGIDVDLKNVPFGHPYKFIYNDDFMTFGFGKTYDLIVGNPPYYDLQNFFEKAIKLIKPHGVVSFLVKSSYLESAIRLPKFKNHRPVSIWQAVNRPVGNHAESYVVVNYQEFKTTIPTTFGWLLSNKKEYSFYE